LPFIEGADVFRAIVPLAAVATGRVGPQSQMTQQVAHQDIHQDIHQDAHQDKLNETRRMILSYCIVPQTMSAIAEHCGYKDRVNFTKLYLKPLLESGLILKTIPDKPSSKNQKYVTAQFGEVK
jgi:ATP-dependent DNA helicase RecG